MELETTGLSGPEIERTSSRRTKISWPAVFAGGLAAMAVVFLLNILGIGIGLSTVDVLSDKNPLRGLGVGTMIWWVIANLIALFVGGAVAGRMSGFKRHIDGGLHGFLSWCLYTIVSIFLLASMIGGVVGGITGAISWIFGGNKFKEVTIKVDRGLDNQSDNSSSLKSKVMKIVNTGERFNILPDDASEEINRFLNQFKKDFKNLDLKDIEDFVNDVNVNLDNNGNLDITVEGNKDFLDKAELKSYLTKNTKLTDQQIDGVITKGENNIEQAVAKTKEIYAKAKEKAKKIADETAEIISAVCIVGFFVLLLGAAAAIFCGVLGSPDYVDYRERRIGLRRGTIKK